MPTQALFLFLFSSSSAYPRSPPSHDPPKEPKELVVIEGMDYCQSCSRVGTWSLEVATPLPAAKVGIACKEYRRNRVQFYKVFQANSQGITTPRLNPEKPRRRPEPAASSSSPRRTAAAIF
ncbi:hypothetical protein AXF42_Ash003950 [Apostasia shenzhenica]|uniref:Uncharacterized protein n=1 Tax=Apostasia shenzhenica TaxID=1088818 RepID=A0A2I0AID2_9ASPA|nr:hypothetical protein AXF42_Ash003950 [Apostasia shenzhenica]